MGKLVEMVVWVQESFAFDVKVLILNILLRVAQATRILRKSRPEIQKFGGFLELASARALRLPSVASRVFRTEVSNQVSRTCWNGVVYRNDSKYECEGERSGGSEFI